MSGISTRSGQDCANLLSSLFFPPPPEKNDEQAVEESSAVISEAEEQKPEEERGAGKDLRSLAWWVDLPLTADVVGCCPSLQ